MPTLPTPLRAALGLVATAIDEARSLPDKAIELPMLAVSSALQMSLRAQQRYARLAARGDDLLAGRSTTDEPPAWATFDAPLNGATAPSTKHPGTPHPGTPRPGTPRPGKAVRRPRTGKPSAFDVIGDE